MTKGTRYIRHQKGIGRLDRDGSGGRPVIRDGLLGKG